VVKTVDKVINHLEILQGKRRVWSRKSKKQGRWRVLSLSAKVRGKVRYEYRCFFSSTLLHLFCGQPVIYLPQTTVALALLRSSCAALISRLSVASSGIRRFRHWRLKTLNSISAMLSQLPCLGV